MNTLLLALSLGAGPEVPDPLPIVRRVTLLEQRVADLEKRLAEKDPLPVAQAQAQAPAQVVPPAASTVVPTLAQAATYAPVQGLFAPQFAPQSNCANGQCQPVQSQSNCANGQCRPAQVQPSRVYRFFR